MISGRAFLRGAAFALCGAAAAVAPPPAGAQTNAAAPASAPPVVAGSQSCRECHEDFYRKWSTSFHGLAMQPFTPELARRSLTAPPKDIRVGATTYRMELDDRGGRVVETGPTGTLRHAVVHAMGGKNVFYFLAQLERGRLQTLPVAYDVRRNEWYDTAASAMRHFQGLTDEAVDWRDPLYTFNTSCHGCHVSQLAANYDPADDAYQTTWTEPGINCETCHGPAQEHNRLFRSLPKDAPKPADIRIIVTKTFTSTQHNDSCSSCHAKASVLTASYPPAAPFFDHFDLAAIEQPDFHPDGRDLGENYTFTSWRMSPCARTGKLDCMHCHTSSGRYRFAGGADPAGANKACLPCHEARVANAAAHTHHPEKSAGNRCISCHMPMTEFARMRRSDHSMRPPTPSATIRFKSPNACNLCHANRDAAWADERVRAWHKDDYQAPVLRLGDLIVAARAQRWERLPEMLDEIAGPKRDEIFATSLIRLLATCPDARKWPVFAKTATADASPLVRGAAAAGLGGRFDADGLAALTAAAGDPVRLVRIRAAGSLAGYPVGRLAPADRGRVEAAFKELEASLGARPDDWSSHYNLGNFHTERGEMAEAVRSFETASRLRPDVVPPLVNAAIAYARLGRNGPAGEALERALRLEPTNAVANLNLGLLLAERGETKRAEDCLRAAFRSDPHLAQAAYNLAVLTGQDRPQEAIEWSGRAFALEAAPRHGFTHAFYLARAGQADRAIGVLQQVVRMTPPPADAVLLLGELYERGGRAREARGVYREALTREGLEDEARRYIEQRLRALSAGGG